MLTGPMLKREEGRRGRWMISGRGRTSGPGAARALATALATALALALVAACDAPEEPAPETTWSHVELQAPVGEGASIPNLFAAADGQIYMNWYEPRDGEGHVLRFAALRPDAAVANGDLNGAPSGAPNGAPNGTSGGAPNAAPGASPGAGLWTEPRTITESDEFFVNWADFPSMYAFSHGLMAAHWPQRSGPGTYDYDVKLAWSEDAGRTWSEPVVPHRDGTQSEHGFVSLFPWDDGSLGAVWLDGRKYVEQPDNPEMTLQFTNLTPTGMGPEVLLDGRVCECCQTSAAVTDDGPVVVYRDRSEAEIRDISIIRLGPEGWSEPVPVHRDGWEIRSCPVNGPMVAAQGRRVAVAWFTAANDEPRVRLAFSDDAGRTFGDPISIDDGNPVGRVAVVMEPGGGATVSWLERLGDAAEIRFRQVSRDGTTTAATTVARSTAARASGFPRMVRAGDGLVFAWTEVGDPGTVRVALLTPEAR